MKTVRAYPHLRGPFSSHIKRFIIYHDQWQILFSSPEPKLIEQAGMYVCCQYFKHFSPETTEPIQVIHMESP